MKGRKYMSEITANKLIISGADDAENNMLISELKEHYADSTVLFVPSPMDLVRDDINEYQFNVKTDTADQRHSLGSLIIEKALLLANDLPRQYPVIILNRSAIEAIPYFLPDIRESLQKAFDSYVRTAGYRQVILTGDIQSVFHDPFFDSNHHIHLAKLYKQYDIDVVNITKAPKLQIASTIIDKLLFQT